MIILPANAWVSALLLAVACARAPRRHRTRAVWAACAVTLAVTAVCHTLVRAQARAAAQDLATVVALCAAWLWACSEVGRLAITLRPTLRLLGVAALWVPWLWLPGLRLTDAAGTEERASPITEVAQLRRDLRAAAAGSSHAGLRAAARAAQLGAEVATLRAWCPARVEATRGQDGRLGAQVCAAVCAPLPELGAASLACGDGAATDGAAQARCRVAGELYAEAGLMSQAEAALGRGGPRGLTLARALFAARGRAMAQAAAPGPTSATDTLWPQDHTLGPLQLGFALMDAPGSLTWHPGAEATSRGVLWAHSRYPGALITQVPGPTPQAPARGVGCALSGGPDFAITLHGATTSVSYRCAGSEQAAADPSPHPLLLPPGACASAVQAPAFVLAPDLGPQGIVGASLHGSYVLAHWQWLTAVPHPPNEKVPP